MIKLRGHKGITLIALVITIIVLLILAGVTIAQITGQDSAPEKAVEAGKKNDQGAEYDSIKIAVVGAVANGNYGEVNAESLKNELNGLVEDEGRLAIRSDNAPWVVIGKTGKAYEITENAEVRGLEPLSIQESITITENKVRALTVNKYGSAIGKQVTWGKEGNIEFVTDATGNTEIQNPTSDTIYIKAGAYTDGTTGKITVAVADDPSLTKIVSVMIKQSLAIIPGTTTISYDPQGSYQWNKEYATSKETGIDTLSSAEGGDYRLTTWNVLTYDEDTGIIEMVPSSTTTGKVGLQGAQGYNNAVKLLNDACSGLYGYNANGKMITARSIKEEDFERIATRENETDNETENAWTRYKESCVSNGITYNTQYSSAFTANNARYYPTMYSLEKKRVIDGNVITTGYGQSEQTSFIERKITDEDTGQIVNNEYSQATTSLQPYQTLYHSGNLQNTRNILGYTNAQLLKFTGSISQQYWVASRCVEVRSDRCEFSVFRTTGHYISNINMLSNNTPTGKNTSSYSLFPIVTLNVNLVEKDSSGKLIVNLD